MKLLIVLAFFVFPLVVQAEPSEEVPSSPKDFLLMESLVFKIASQTKLVEK